MVALIIDIIIIKTTMQGDRNLQECLAQSIIEATEVEELVNKLNNLKAEDLDSMTNSQEYLDFLGTIIYSLNCTVHSYAHLKSMPVPEQFNKVKQYYQKVKQSLKKQEEAEKPGPKSKQKKRNKQAVDRLIRHHIN